MKVMPRTNGRICSIAGEYGAAATSIVPASVEMATAPMLIQYGGPSRSMVMGRNVKR